MYTLSTSFERTIMAMLFIFAILCLAVYIALGVHTSRLASGMSDKLALVVGVTAGVEPNPYNTMAQQLVQKELQLNDKEQQLRAQEQAMEANLRAEVARSERNTLLTVLGVTLLLLGLIATNFYFDRKREREEQKMAVLQFQTKL